MKDLTPPTPDLQAVRDETIASGQHKDLIRACSLAGLSYADCMRIVAYMPVLSNHEDGGRAATAAEDARRYRWLRAGNYPISFARSVLNDTPHGIDAAIDAAIAFQPPRGV